MDFLDPQKKRAHNIRLYIGYFLMAIALGIATLILVFAAYGFDIDRKTGDVIQNGLIVIDSHPVQSNIKINGEDKGTTSNRHVLPAGEYDIELSREGYRTWYKHVELEGGSIEQLVYPFIFPKELVTSNIYTLQKAPTLVSQSPDRKWVVISVDEKPGMFKIIDLGNDKYPVGTIELPADSLTLGDGTHEFEAVEWSDDNVHLIIKHKFSDKSEFIMIDRNNPTQTYNLTKYFASQNFDSITLKDKKSDNFYLHNSTTGNLFNAVSKLNTINLIASNVELYKSYEDDTLMFVTKPVTSVTSNVYIRIKDKDYLLRSIPISNKYLLDIAKFNSNFYFLVGGVADNRTYIYKDPINDLVNSKLEPQPYRVLIVADSQYVSFSGNARFVAVQGKSSFAILDNETSRNFNYDIKLPLLDNQKAVWMDGHRLVINSNNKTVIFDFDGTNMHHLTSSLGAYGSFFDRDYNALITFDNSINVDGGIETQKTDLKIKK